MSEKGIGLKQERSSNVFMPCYID